MTLPSFLGIGAQKAGTTWLHELLASHPDILMPQRRKEVHYFDWHYHKGTAWYASFFPNGAQETKSVVGEITPDYMFEERCAERIATLLPQTKLIAILRDPVARAYSQYTMQAAEFNWDFSFEKALEAHPDLLKRGHYDQQLEPYRRLYPKHKMLVLIFEEAVSDPEFTKRQLAQFLDVDAQRFPAEAGHEKVFGRYQPKYKRLFAMAKWLSFQLHKYDVDWLVESAKQLGLRRLFGQGASPEPLSSETETSLRLYYEASLTRLEASLGRPIPAWQRSSEARDAQRPKLERPLPV